MTREELFKQSIAAFQSQNVLVWKVKRIYTSSGYCYIIKQSSRETVATFHYNNYVEQTLETGRLIMHDGSITSREKLYLDEVVEYEGMHFGITSTGNWNETMKQWSYSCQAALNLNSSTFLITSEDEINQKLGYSSFSFLFSAPWDFPFLPGFCSSETNQKCILANVNSSTSITPIYFIKDFKNQICSDSIELYFINLTTQEVSNQMYKLQEYTLSPEAKFGIRNTPSIIQKSLVQVSMNWTALIYAAELEIFYNMYLEEVDSTPEISKILFKNMASI